MLLYWISTGVNLYKNMQAIFPTKKFFIVLLFIVLVAGGTYGLFGVINRRAAQNTPDKQNLSLLQKEALRPKNNAPALTAEQVQRVATSTINAVAAVVYLNEQTKANGATMGEITGKVGKQIQDAKEKLDADAYTKNDLTISSDDSPSALKKYGNDLAGILFKYGSDRQTSDYFQIIKKGLEKKDPKEFAKLDPFITFEKNVIRDALALSVPPAASTAHLHFLNGSAEFLLLLQGFQNTLTDFPSAIAANSRIVKSSVRLGNSFLEIGALLKQHGVVFLPEDAGGFFTKTSVRKN